MKHILTYLLLWIGIAVWLEAAVRSDVVVIEASEGVQYSTQKIAKDYLLSYVYPEKRSFRKRVYNNLIVLDKNIKAIATHTKDKKTKGILSYFATEKAQIIELLNEKSTSEGAESMVGFSEIFVEGSKSISKHHSYNFSKEEKMLMLTREMSTLLENITKYYVAIGINVKDLSYRKNMKKMVSFFQEGLKNLNQYSYSDELKETKVYLNRSWRVMQAYLNKVDSLKAPALLSISSKNIQMTLEKFSIYHSKNQ